MQQMKLTFISSNISQSIATVFECSILPSIASAKSYSSVHEMKSLFITSYWQTNLRQKHCVLQLCYPLWSTIQWNYLTVTITSIYYNYKYKCLLWNGNTGRDSLPETPLEACVSQAASQK